MLDAENVAEKISDAELNRRLERWARWCKSGGPRINLGYPSCSIEQTANMGQASKRLVSFDDELSIEILVSKMASSQPSHAEVVRHEFGACRSSFDPWYDEPIQSISAKQLGLSVSKYRRYLKEAKEIIRFGLSFPVALEQ